MSDNLSWGKTLKEIREAKGLTQEYIAKKINRTRSFVCDMENGKANIDEKDFTLWLKALNISEIEFFEYLRAKQKPEIKKFQLIPVVGIAMASFEDFWCA
ncbi:MAG: helix-turn-helix transcriptional regulator, partial [Candidatus Aenigmatarchaeota archaeon]